MQLSKTTLQWRHNECDGVSNHQPLDCLLNVCSGTYQRKHQSSVSRSQWGQSLSQRASNAEIFFIWWRHYELAHFTSNTNVITAKQGTECLSVVWLYNHIDGTVQDCSISIANAMEILQSCTKPSISSAKETCTWPSYRRWYPSHGDFDAGIRSDICNMVNCKLW